MLVLCRYLSTRGVYCTCGKLGKFLFICVSLLRRVSRHTPFSPPPLRTPSCAPSETSTLRALVSIDLACIVYPSSVQSFCGTPSLHYPSCATLLAQNCLDLATKRLANFSACAINSTPYPDCVPPHLDAKFFSALYQKIRRDVAVSPGASFKLEFWDL